jgi:hypothetical protein
MANQELTNQTVIKTWLWQGLNHFYLAFELGEGKWLSYQPYFDALGLEVFAKTYFIAKRSEEFDGLSFEDAKVKIDVIARQHSHNLKNLLNALNSSIGENKIQHLLSSNFDGFSGSQICEVLMAANNEIRYPVPKPISENFPIEGTDMAWYPLMSSGLSKFAYAVSREIMFALKHTYGLGMSKSDMQPSILTQTEGAEARFCRLFFNNEPGRYLID